MPLEPGPDDDERYGRRVFVGREATTERGRHTDPSTLKNELSRNHDSSLDDSGPPRRCTNPEGGNTWSRPLRRNPHHLPDQPLRVGIRSRHVLVEPRPAELGYVEIAVGVHVHLMREGHSAGPP